MKFIQYDSVHPYLERVEPVLLQNEAVNNLPLGILYNLATSSSAENEDNLPFYGLVEEEGHVVLVTLMTPPYNIVLYGEGSGIDEALATAVSYLLAHQVQVPGVIGPKGLAHRFAVLWAEHTHCEVKEAMKQRIYKLESVNTPPERSGQFRQATMEDLPIIKDWIIAFQKESLHEDVTDENAHKAAERGIQSGRYFLWTDPVPVSMAARIRPIRHGISVGAVYTPPAQRKKGYASACVAALSQLLLDEGFEFVSLYTDLANNTSNHIYMKMGYQPIADSVMLLFS